MAQNISFRAGSQKKGVQATRLGYTAAMDFLIFFGFMLLVLAAGAVFVVRRGLEMKKLAREGQPARARIVRKEKVRRKGSDSSALTYEFQDSFGDTHRRRIHVVGSVFDSYQEGDNLEIVYLLDKPQVNGAKYMVEMVKKALP
ncbi:MAG TPA: DUF3592 domain-containing protein [bacterium]|nr:DUF3592 domain-containing protein [bacterium]